MNAIIKIIKRGPEYWYMVGYYRESGEAVLGEPQYGGQTEEEAIENAKIRFGYAYDVVL